MTNRRMLLTGVALSTGLLLVGEGCMSAAPKASVVAAAAPISIPASTPTPTLATTEEPSTTTQTGPAKEEPVGTRHALVDAMRGCQLMKAQAGNTKGPSYVDVCVR